MHKVWFLLLPGFLLADVLGVMAVFKAANALRKRRHRLAAYGVRLTSLQGGHVVGSGGVGLATRLPPPQLAGPSNSLVLSGMPDGVRVGDGSTSMQRLRAWLSNGRRRLRRCALLGSKTLLPLMPRIRLGRPRTSTPPTTPVADVQAPAHFTTRAAARGWQNFDANQGVDLALSWIEQDCGRQFADTVALRLRGRHSHRYGKKRYRRMRQECLSLAPRIVTLHAWIEAHLSEKISVAAMAQQVHMSSRSFARFYRRETGVTPAQGVIRLRLEAARRLIEASELPLKTIAAQCGYGSQEVMRRAFLRSLRMTPLEYRQRHGPPDDPSRS
ncbi:helix-turn-helix domain-containing protein [Variovorax sp. UC74_104]|uniref:helix-turn-helix domain-containing protein n=1 Tax=Variovorax sp. UC74_104 TaxID=3374555 RepID=UPI003758146F